MISFTGNLEFLPIVDVLQLLHQSRKSGILRVKGRKGESLLVFKDGYMVSANHLDSSIRIGQVLVELNIISHDILDNALQVQQSAGADRKPLIVTLIDGGLVSEKDAYKGLEHLIEMAVVEILTWKKGTFTFEILPTSVHDFSFYPERLLGEVNVDTQGVLMEALRIFDEKVRDGELSDEEPADEIVEKGADAAPRSDDRQDIAVEEKKPLPPQRRSGNSPRSTRSARTPKPIVRSRNMICVCPSCRYWTFETEMFEVCPRCGWQNVATLPNHYVGLGYSALGVAILFYGLYGLGGYYGNDWREILSESRVEPVSNVEVFLRLGFLPWLFTLFGGIFILVVRRFMQMKRSAGIEMRLAAWSGIAVFGAYEVGEFVSWIRIGNSPSFSYYAAGLGHSFLMAALFSLPFLALLRYVRGKLRAGR